MSSKISVQNFIKNYTKGANLSIPLIQRNYKWPANVKNNNTKELYTTNEKGKRNTAHNLIWEIIDNKEKDKPMTLGIVVLYNEKHNDNNIKRLILDGQQRIITLSLIVRCLLKKINYVQNSQKKMADEWFQYTFERDFDSSLRQTYMFNDEHFSAVWKNYKERIRQTYMLNDEPINNINENRLTSDQSEKEDMKSVDLKRMEENYKQISDVIDKNIEDMDENKKVEYYENLLSYIKNNIFFIVRTTTTPPLDEFLNVNNYKTPFSICDYIKVLLLNDIYANTKLSDEGKLDKKNEVLGLYRDIAYYLYYKDENTYNKDKYIDNSIYEMVSGGYDNVCGSSSVNRMDLIFEDKYNPDNKKTIEIDKADIISIYENNENPFESEIKRIKYFRNVLKGIEEELYSKDSKDKKHTNSNAFNSFYVLNKYNKERRFFSLFNDHNINSQKDPNEIIKEFCLQEFCVEQTKKLENLEASNEFIDSVMHYKINNNIAEENRITVNNTEKFEKVNNLFLELYDEYVEIIKKGKELNEPQRRDESIEYIEPNGKDSTSNCESDKYSIKDLFGKYKQIIIPDLQREYIKGCDAEDFLNDILEKNTRSTLNKIISCILNPSNEDNNVKKSLEYCINQINSFFNNIVFKQDYYCTIQINAKEFLKNYLYEYLVSGKPPQDLWTLVPQKNVCEYMLDMRRKENRIFTLNYNLKRINKETDLINNIKKYLNDYLTKDKDTKYTASCVVGYCDANNNLFIYDGQQRIVTFLCAIGFLKRKAEDISENINELYKKFIFSGRPKANEAIEILYTENSDDDKLLEKLQLCICDQTTDAIYKIVKMLKEKFDVGVFMSYNYFYDMMMIEYYGIDQLDETAQLFMDINDGCRLEPYEIYKAEFIHYLIEKGSCESAKEIQKKLDNSFIDLFVDSDKPEEKEIKVLKELVKITYIERFHDYKYSDFPTSLSDIVDKFADSKFIEKLNKYMTQYECFKNNNSDSIINFCVSDQYNNINKLKYTNIFNDYHFEDSDNGLVLLYCNFEKLKEKLKTDIQENINLGDLLQSFFANLDPNLNLDLCLKIRYDLSTKGYLALENFKCNYNLNDQKVEKKFNDLLKEMTTKDFRDDSIEGNKVEYSPKEANDKNVIKLNSDANILSDILSNNSMEIDDLENLFFGKNVKLDLSKFRKTIIEKLEELPDKSTIYSVFVSNYDIVYISDNDVYVYDNDEYKKIQSDNDTIMLYGMELKLEEIMKYAQKNVNIKKLFENTNNSNIEERKMQLLVLLLLTYKKLDPLKNLKLDNDDNVFYIENNRKIQFKYKDDMPCTFFKEQKNYYYYNKNMELVPFKEDEL